MEGEKFLPGVPVETDEHAPVDALDHVPVDIHPELEKAGVRVTAGESDIQKLLDDMQSGNENVEPPIVSAHQFEEAHEEEPPKKNIFKRIFDKIFKRGQ